MQEEPQKQDNNQQPSEVASEKTQGHTAGESFRNAARNVTQTTQKAKKAVAGGVDPKQLISAKMQGLKRNINRFNQTASSSIRQAQQNAQSQQLQNRQRLRTENASMGQPGGGSAQQSGEETTEKETVTEENTSSRNRSRNPLQRLLDRSEETEAEEVEEQESSGFSLFGKNKNGAKNTVTAVVKGFIKMQLLPILGFVLITFMFILLLVLIPVVIVSGVANIFSFDTAVTGEEDIDNLGEVDETNEELIAILDEYPNEDKTQLGRIVHAIEFVFLSYQDGQTYEELSEAELKEVVDLVVGCKNGSTYDLNLLQTKLADEFFPSKIPDYTQQDYQSMAEEVIEYLENYNELINDDQTSQGVTTTGDQCSYDLTRVHYENNFVNANIKPSNIKVRLMQATSCGGTTGEPLANEELVDFEKYVLGVAYAEVGNIEQEEAFKTQLIMARNFALINSVAHSRNDLKLENGQWIMEISNCNADQYYCDPDQGCDWATDPVTTNSYPISGTGTGYSTWKGPLAEDAPQREWAQEVLGKTFVDSEGQLVWTNFTNSTQERAKALADQGLDYTSILLEIYPSGSSVAAGSCTVDTSNYANWKQTDPTWSNVILGGGTNTNNSVGNIGCLVTSLAILAEKSNALTFEPLPTLVTASNFNPGTFAQALNEVDSFSSDGSLNSYQKVTEVIPAFVYAGSTSLSNMSQSEKLTAITDRVNSGYYCTAHVISGSSGTHFVAIDKVEGNTIKMFDPGSKATDMWAEYDWEETDRIECYRVGS